MIIINSLDQLNLKKKTSVALGNFDGIHIGHREVFRAALDAAKQQDLDSLCFTFSNHPFNFILRRDDSDPDAVKLICTEEEKIALIEKNVAALAKTDAAMTIAEQVYRII